MSGKEMNKLKDWLTARLKDTWDDGSAIKECDRAWYLRRPKPSDVLITLCAFVPAERLDVLITRNA